MKPGASPKVATIARSEAAPWRAAFPEAAAWDAPIETGNVPAILERAAVRHPDRAAIAFREWRIGFRELARTVAEIAGGLLRAGIGPEETVALYLPNTAWHPVLFFAVVRTGARVMHLSPLDAVPELAAKLRDSGARWLITTDLPPLLSNALRLLAEGAVERLFVGEDAAWGRGPIFPLPTPWSEKVSRLPRAAPSRWPEPGEDEICLLQYTGGTTGVPKGAMLSHRNLTAAVGMARLWQDGAPGGGPQRAVAVLPFFHIYALGSVLLRQISEGNELLLHTRFDADTLLDDIADKRATIFSGVPTMWIALANHPRASQSDFSSLRSCSSGGAPMPLDVRQRIEHLVGQRLLGGWGMTETSGCGTRIPLDAKPVAGLIGIPLPGIDLRVVDRADASKVLAPGLVGELAVRGENVFCGYWNRPEETEAAFHDGYFLTGDIGLMDREGLFRLLDRKKNMIICGGYNVYPAVVENAIHEHPAIAEAIVIGVADAYRGESAKAFVTLRTGAKAPTLGELNVFLAERIGRHELPAALEIRESLPRSAAGKLLARVLQEEERSKRDQSA